jgi:hypothetical protein
MANTNWQTLDVTPDEIAATIDRYPALAHMPLNTQIRIAQQVKAGLRDNSNPIVSVPIGGGKVSLPPTVEVPVGDSVETVQTGPQSRLAKILRMFGLRS